MIRPPSIRIASGSVAVGAKVTVVLDARHLTPADDLRGQKANLYLVSNQGKMLAAFEGDYGDDRLATIEVTVPNVEHFRLSAFPTGHRQDVGFSKVPGYTPPAPEPTLEQRVARLEAAFLTGEPEPAPPPPGPAAPAAPEPEDDAAAGPEPSTDDEESEPQPVQ